jgi:hypothetical protein
LADALVTIVTSDQVFDAEGNCISPRIETQLRILSQQVVDFARPRAKADSESSVGAKRGIASDIPQPPGRNMVE